jgi:protein PET117
MHAGVLRDMERQKQMKERQLDFDVQKALEEEYKKLQPVHDTTNTAGT